MSRPDSNRPVRPLASGPDGERNHWRPMEELWGGRDRWREEGERDDGG